jgi:hypothetical protein
MWSEPSSFGASDSPARVLRVTRSRRFDGGPKLWVSIRPAANNRTWAVVRRWSTFLQPRQRLRLGPASGVRAGVFKFRPPASLACGAMSQLIRRKIEPRRAIRTKHHKWQ